MTKGRFLYEEKMKGHPNIGVYGLFSTKDVRWSYYVISYNVDKNSNIFLTAELCKYSSINIATLESIGLHGLKVNTLDEGKQFISLYKIKWETGSNNTTEEQREEKLNTILSK